MKMWSLHFLSSTARNLNKIVAFGNILLIDRHANETNYLVLWIKCSTGRK